MICEQEVQRLRERRKCIFAMDVVSGYSDPASGLVRDAAESDVQGLLCTWYICTWLFVCSLAGPGLGRQCLPFRVFTYDLDPGIPHKVEGYLLVEEVFI